MFKCWNLFLCRTTLNFSSFRCFKIMKNDQTKLTDAQNGSEHSLEHSPEVQKNQNQGCFAHWFPSGLEKFYISALCTPSYIISVRPLLLPGSRILLAVLGLHYLSSRARTYDMWKPCFYPLPESNTTNIWENSF